MVKKIYYRHYITTRPDGAITDGWSDGPFPQRDTADAICINDQGSYQFRLGAGGEENPPIRTEDNNIPLYRWDGHQVIPRTEEELEAERAALPDPGPMSDSQEQLRADVDALTKALHIMLTGEGVNEI